MPEPEQGAGGDLQGVPADGVGVHEQRPGFFEIGVPLLAGRISSEQLRKAADLAERYADGHVRFTDRPGLLLFNVPREKVTNVLEGLQSVGLRVNPAQPAESE